jgi:hypothetical protein
MQENQQQNVLASGDNKEKATSVKIVAPVEALAYDMKGYQYAWTIDGNDLVVFLNAHCVVQGMGSLTMGMLNSPLRCSNKKKTASGNQGE